MNGEGLGQADLDPYREDHEPPPVAAPRDLVVLRQFLIDLHKFLDDVFAHPPDALRGDWFSQEAAAWEALGRQFGARAMVDRLDRLMEGNEYVPGDQPIEVRAEEHGLTGEPLRAKMNAWRDRARGFLQLRAPRRLSKALRTAGVIAESIIEMFGWGHAYKEALKGFNHLVDLVIEEGSG